MGVVELQWRVHVLRSSCGYGRVSGMGTGVGKAPTSVGKQLSVSSSSSGKYRHWGAPLGVIELQWQIEMLRKLLGV